MAPQFISKQVQVHLLSTKTLTVKNHSRLTNLFAVIIPRMAAPSVAALNLKPGSRININKAHELLGHVSENIIEKCVYVCLEVEQQQK